MSMPSIISFRAGSSPSWCRRRAGGRTWASACAGFRRSTTSTSACAWSTRFPTIRKSSPTNVDGAPLDEPHFWPIYEIIEKSGRPILLHPMRTREMADYRTETKSKYEICSVIGWPYETGVALARLVFSSIMDAFPQLTVITHHLGGIIPYFEGRVGHSWDQLGARTSDEDYDALLKRLRKRPYDYFKDFYGDTALAGSRAATVCGIEFFGVDHVVFASDCPFDPEQGRGYIRATIAVMESLDLDPDDKAKICHRNAERLFGLG
jgi:predicted TIM-barrel fold metal-dependent hydrolase